MARILFTWELGGGMGHMAPYLPLINGLRDKGHEVAFALRNLGLAQTTLGKWDIPYFQAPVLLGQVADRINQPHTFAQLLHNVGYVNRELLTGLAKGWKQLFNCYQPDLIAYDHSPTALLASRDIKCKKLIIGTGFYLPPDSHKPAILRHLPAPQPERIQQDEARILGNINHVLSELGSTTIERISQLFQADDYALLTFKELDHYQQRPGQDVTYWGVPYSGLGNAPTWPQGEGKRIFAYLKPHPSLPALLQTLHDLQAPCIIYAPEVADYIKQQFTSQTLYFSIEPLDLTLTAESCDIAITNANHSTTITFLMAGKPLLLLPLYQEQQLLAENIERLGAGLIAPLNDPVTINTKLRELLHTPRFAEAASAFSGQYGDYNPCTMTHRLIEHINRLLTDIGLAIKN